MRLTRDKVEQLHEVFSRDPTLEFIEIEEGATDGKLRAFTVQTIEKRKPLGLKSLSPRL